MSSSNVEEVEEEPPMAISPSSHWAIEVLGAVSLTVTKFPLLS